MVSFAGTADRAGERTRNTTKFPSFPDANAAAQNVRFALAVWGDNATHTLSISATFFAWWKRAFLHVLVSLRTLFSAANLRAAGGERCCVGYWRYNLILPSTRHKRRCSSCTKPCPWYACAGVLFLLLFVSWRCSACWSA